MLQQFFFEEEASFVELLLDTNWAHCRDYQPRKPVTDVESGTHSGCQAGFPINKLKNCHADDFGLNKKKNHRNDPFMDKHRPTLVLDTKLGLVPWPFLGLLFRFSL